MDITKTLCELQGHSIIRICGEWCINCKDFPRTIAYNKNTNEDIDLKPLTTDG
jgi:hypothetical protein